MIIKNSKSEYEVIKKPKTLNGMRCINCNSIATEEHHLIPSRAYRRKCEALGLTIALCHRCHWLLHNDPKSGLYHIYKKFAQKIFEKELGSRKDWMAIFHKNYLWEEE